MLTKLLIELMMLGEDSDRLWKEVDQELAEWIELAKTSSAKKQLTNLDKSLWD